MKEKEVHKKPDIVSDGRIHEHVEPRQLTPLEKKVNDICRLAVKKPELFEPAEVFLSFLVSRRRAVYRMSKEHYPVESERLAQAREALGEENLKLEADAVNKWLRDEGRPELQLTTDEILKIRYGD